jgi:hypothetical protein
MRSTHLALAIACATGGALGCSIDRTPPLVAYAAESVEADSDGPAADGETAARFAGFTQAVARDGGIALGAGAQAGSGGGLVDAHDEDAGAGCAPAEH